MKLLHTSDWQIGMKAEAVGAVAQRVREERLAAARRVICAAEENGAEMIVIAGDVFEDNAVDRSLVRQVGDILKAFGGPVFIIPGNHDPLVPGSVWEHPVWSEGRNIQVCRTPNAIELEECVVFPCPLKEKYSTANPMAWIDAGDREKIGVALAHGNVEGIADADADYPISRDAAVRYGLDYVALGHWHSYATFQDGGAERMAYSGSHETTKFGERDSGNAVLVELRGRGAPPSLKPVKTGGLTWLTLEESIERSGDAAQLTGKLDAISNPETTLLRIRLSGILFPEDQGHLNAVEEILSTRFLYGGLDAGALLPAPEGDEWIESLPTGTIRAAAERLRETAARGGDERQREVATQALLQLFELKGLARS